MERRSTRGLCALIALGVCLPAHGEDRRSAETMIEGCRYAAARPAPVKDAEWTQALDCRDAIRVVVQNGPIQPKFLASCVPETTKPKTIAAVVVDFLEANPARKTERFDMLASIALHGAWPCQK